MPTAVQFILLGVVLGTFGLLLLLPVFCVEGTVVYILVQYVLYQEIDMLTVAPPVLWFCHTISSQRLERMLAPTDLGA
jgi:hypothetical protein